MKTVRLVTWNLENLFHPETGGPRFDYTPHEGWTVDLYKAKIARLAGVFNQMINNYTQKHKTGLIFGLTEIENPGVAQELIESMDKSNFKIAVDPDFEHSYHDTLIIYDGNFYDIVHCRYHQVFERYDKGDVCEVQLKIKGTEELLTVFCCHFKARPSNKYYTQMYRQAVCDNIQNLIWRMHGGFEIQKEIQRIKDDTTSKPTQFKTYPNVVVMGDFNDEPFSTSITDYMNATYDINFVRDIRDLGRVPLYNASWEKLMSEKPGTNYYEGSFTSRWTMLDQMVVSPSLVSLEKKEGLRYRKGSFDVIQNLTADSKGIPFRTITWDEDDNQVFQEGYSDHFPVTLELEYLEG